ncbi:MAG TPA: methylenetetrahydrofolate reductase [Humibacter sp.]|jgi:methylenetetrahydrofolate reductase (NADPH)|nr:methylenetetrahydrofolate reductase [Humibacter sp.]
MTDSSLEMTAKDAADVAAASVVLAPGTRVNITSLGSETAASRVEAARAVSAAGLAPVPHLSARRLRNSEEFERYLEALKRVDASQTVFVVGGDPATPEGPFESAESLLRTGLLQEYGVRNVGVAGYPDGHPEIADAELWRALHAKVDLLAELGLGASITTQFTFDEAPVLAWIERVREEGIEVPIRVGVPGPTGVRRLLGYSRRFGIGANATIVKKYGFSLTNLLGAAGPGVFIDALEQGYDPARHGVVTLHFYTFGGLAATAQWLRDAR